jgi:hypothetical protein
MPIVLNWQKHNRYIAPGDPNPIPITITINDNGTITAVSDDGLQYTGEIKLTSLNASLELVDDSCCRDGSCVKWR